MAGQTQDLNAPSAAVIASGNADDQMRFWLAFLMIGGTFGFIGIAIFIPPKLPGDTLGVILGYLAGWISSVVFFYFGSSSGSKLKTMSGQG